MGWGQAASMVPGMSEQRRRSALKLWKRQKGICAICGLTMRPPWLPNAQPTHPRAATLDHIIPASRGGPTDRRNLRLTCYECNYGRGTEPDEREAGVAIVLGI